MFGFAREFKCFVTNLQYFTGHFLPFARNFYRFVSNLLSFTGFVSYLHGFVSELQCFGDGFYVTNSLYVAQSGSIWA